MSERSLPRAPRSVTVNSVDRLRHALRELLRVLPVPLRHAAIGAVVFGFVGGLVGLVIGLRTYVPTAWAAVFEVGLPAAVLGVALGLVIGSLICVCPHARHN
jgi:hypothetical protein